MPLVISNKLTIHSQLGFSLIEILATVFIVSFGLLGLMKLQTSNYSNINNAIFTQKAGFFAESLIQKLKGNVTAAQASNSPYVIADFTDTPSAAAETPVCVSSNCTTSELATYDINTWLHKVKNGLPKGKARVLKTDNGSSSTYTIDIQWQYKSDTKSYQLVAQI